MARVSRGQKAALAVTAVLALVVSCGVAYRATSSAPGTASTNASTNSNASLNPNSNSVPIGSSTHYIESGGRQRMFRLYRPAGLTGPVPLVVMLHGGFGSASQAEDSYGWDARADAGHFLVAYPDGVNHAWNAGGGCCGTPAASGVDDVAFIGAVVALVRGEVPVDPSRIYATGISNGGIMAYRLACETRLFAAIGPDSATLLGSCPAPGAVSVIAIHGTADHNIPYNGGRGDGPGHIDGPAVPTVIADWRATDQCPAPSTAVAGAVTTSLAVCPSGRAVELITVAGAGHQWPGSAAKPVIQRLLGLDAPSKALSATDVIWRFFAAHPAA